MSHGFQKSCDNNFFAIYLFRTLSKYLIKDGVFDVKAKNFMYRDLIELGTVGHIRPKATPNN